MPDITKSHAFITSSIGTCGTTAIMLPATNTPGRKSWIAYNDGTTTVYIGPSTVTAANGIPVGTSAYSPAIDAYGANIYGITAGGAGTVRIFELSLPHH